MAGLDSIGVWQLARGLSALERVQESDPAVHARKPGARDEKPTLAATLGAILQICDMASVRTRNVETARTLKLEVEQARSASNPHAVTAQEAEHAHAIAVGLRTELEVILENRRFSEPIPPDGVMNYDKLRVGDFATLVDDQSVVWSLPAPVQSDLKESVRALMSNVPTGATMLALRGAEGMVREAYGWIFPNEKGHPTWDEAMNKVATKLEELGIDSEDVKAYSTFLRKFRNRAQHPGEVFSTKDAERAVQDAARLAVILAPIKEKVRVLQVKEPRP